MKIVQLLPFLPPYPHGISDYALKLAEQLLMNYGISSHFIACAGQDSTLSTVEQQFSGIVLPNRSPETLLSHLPSDLDGVIIHFDFELYRLLHALKSAKQSQLQNTALIIMFHELIPRWKMSLKQKTVFCIKQFLPVHDPGPYSSPIQMAKIADVVLTNTKKFQHILSNRLKRSVQCISSFSNVGEPSFILPLEKRDRRIVVFGTAQTRQRVYVTHAKSLFELCHVLGITEICDIGVPHELSLIPPKGIHITEMGVQSADQISEILSHSLAGFIDYSHSPGTLGKSGVFAAYCAHGLLPVSSQPLQSEADGVGLDHHYVALQSHLQDLSLSQLQAIADRAFTWYSSHNLRECAKVFATHLLELSAKSKSISTF
jgi:hypothetical protein